MAHPVIAQQTGGSATGRHHMARVQSPAFGASERFVVSPGHEQNSIFEMPCGQSGNPLSPHLLAGHETRMRGDAAPFLPAPIVHTLKLNVADAFKSIYP